MTTTRVAVNGYGVIGKRVADAVRAMPDMELVGVADVAIDWRIRTATGHDIPPDARTVVPDLDVVTMAAKAANTESHSHYWALQLTHQASREEALDALRAAPRIAFGRMSDGLVALNTTVELMPDLGEFLPAPAAVRGNEAVKGSRT